MTDISPTPVDVLEQLTQPEDKLLRAMAKHLIDNNEYLTIEQLSKKMEYEGAKSIYTPRKGLLRKRYIVKPKRSVTDVITVRGAEKLRRMGVIIDRRQLELNLLPDETTAEIKRGGTKDE